MARTVVGSQPASDSTSKQLESPALSQKVVEMSMSFFCCSNQKSCQKQYMSQSHDVPPQAAHSMHCIAWPECFVALYLDWMLFCTWLRSGAAAFNASSCMFIDFIAIAVITLII